MATPQQRPPHGPRKSGRKNKQGEVPNGIHIRAAVSDNEVSHHVQHDGAQIAGISKPRRKSQANRMNGDGPQSGSVSDNPRSNARPEKTKATPIKHQAYAGPTFHQSPAASALPIPSFYSKSVPDVSAAQPPKAVPEVSNERHVSKETDASPTRAKRESTPLDFLFDAARQARVTPRAESPGARSGTLSVPSESPAPRSPAPKNPDPMFPFELDGASAPGEDGSAFSTPYKDRINALRTVKSTSDGVKSMDEQERRAKTEALKKFLMRSSESPDPQPVVDTSNPFNARAPQPRQHSGPSTPAYAQPLPSPSRPDQYSNNMPQPSPRHSQFPQYAPNGRPASNLRNVYGAFADAEAAELSSDNAITPPRVSTARRTSNFNTPPPPYRESVGIASPAQQTPKHTSKPSAQQLEDDLRRVLKLNLTSKG